MPEIEPVGEFGSKEWCVACAEAGAQMLREADLPPDIEWGFSEIYTHAPERLLAGGREMSAYYIMVKDGNVYSAPKFEYTKELMRSAFDLEASLR